MRYKLLQKRFTGKTAECSKHLHHIAIEKDILSELNRCIFQIPLKYIKLVIPKILFILVLCSFNFYFKTMWPYPPHPPSKIIPPANNIISPPKLKFLTSPPAKTFLKFLTPLPQAGGGLHALKAQLKLSPLIQNLIQQDYLPESFARHLPSYQKMSQNCCTHQVWIVPPAPESLWVALGMGKSPTQQPKIYSFLWSEKSSIIDLNISLSKVSFLPHQNAIFK